MAYVNDVASINVLQGYSKKIQTAYVKESLVASRLSSDYEFFGAKTVRVMNPQTVPMSNYSRTGTNRYGTPTEMQDLVQELTCTQDKSFSLTIDEGNYEDQGHLKRARQMLSLQMAERAIPEMDKYLLTKLVAEAGNKKTDTAPTKSNIVARISLGTIALDDAEVPESGRTLFINATQYNNLKNSEEFIKIERLGDKALSKGVVGEFDGMQVVKIPAGRLPEGMNFLIVHKNAAVAPVKIDKTFLHQNPPGINGNLLEGRQYYDCFVFTAKENGVYADVTTT